MTDDRRPGDDYEFLHPIDDHPNAPGADRRQSPLRAIRIVSASSFAGLQAPAREWHVDGLVPADTVTLLNGDGGTGKSLLALQLAVATAARSHWIGLPVTSGACLYLSAEDDMDELHRRISTISERTGIDVADLSTLDLAPLAGEDALLAVADGKSNVMKPTPLFAAVERQIDQSGPTLVVLDTLADLYGGEENQRAQARQFVGMLRGWAIKYHCAVLLLAHPSLAGMASGSGSSGSTAWNNSVRSRLYLERISSSEGGKSFEPDPDARVLRTVKSNYGRTGAEIPLQWIDGILVQKHDRPNTGLAVMASENRADDTFLRILAAFSAEGRHVSATPSANYAPAVFARDIRADGITKRGFSDAMSRLFAAKRIAVETHGPESRKRSVIKIVVDEPRKSPEA